MGGGALGVPSSRNNASPLFGLITESTSSASEEIHAHTCNQELSHMVGSATVRVITALWYIPEDWPSAIWWRCALLGLLRFL